LINPGLVGRETAEEVDEGDPNDHVMVEEVFRVASYPA
jgi:hypothetical protein